MDLITAAEGRRCAGRRRLKTLRGGAVVPEIRRIEHIDHAVFSAADEHVLSGNQDWAAGAQIEIQAVQLGEVRRRKPVEERARGAELQERVGEIRGPVIRAVAGQEVNRAGGIADEAASGLPHSAVSRAGSGVVNRHLLLYVRGIVSEDPAVKRKRIGTTAAEARVNVAVGQQQRGPLYLGGVVEREHAPNGIERSSRNPGGYGDRAA